MLPKTHKTILQLMATSQKLRTKAITSEVDAWIGHMHIDADLVKELERDKLIRCSAVWHKNWEQGKLCDFELTDKGREAAH